MLRKDARERLRRGRTKGNNKEEEQEDFIKEKEGDEKTNPKKEEKCKQNRGYMRGSKRNDREENQEN